MRERDNFEEALHEMLDGRDAENKRLRDALTPFAKAWKTVTSNSAVHHLSLSQLARLCECEISAVDYQRAARTLEEMKL